MLDTQPISNKASIGQLCVHQIFELQVDRTPAATAIVWGDTALTYAELNIRSNQIARAILKIGLSANAIVGLYVNRSLEMLIAMLGILKAGGAYLPLDPSYPQERLEFMLRDAEVSVIITQGSLLARLPSCPARVINLDTDGSDILQEPTHAPVCQVHPESLAYVMYTSGSTGHPKGVCVPHRAVVRLVKETDYASFDPDQVFLQFAPLSFDASTFEIWGALLNGGKVVIPPAGKLSLADLGQIIQDYQITTLWLTAGLFHLMVQERLSDLSPIHQLLAGGDVLSVPHVQKLLRAHQHCRLINGYGPTENTTFTCCYTISNPDDLQSSVPIGRPIAHTQVYVLTEELQPVADGEVGELYAGGDGLALGYLNRPDLTAERFIPNPFGQDLGERLYKTGDLVRYRPDGNLEFLGRIDHQVKIRGYRIELLEVERAISQHPSVQQVVVIAQNDPSGNKRLVAYLKLQDPQPDSSQPVQTFLQDRLPDYMIPSWFVVVKEFPLTLNGKVDRQALPDPTQHRPDLPQPYIAPLKEIEKQLANLWSQLLQLDQVGIRDNFFDLGGTSLLSLKLVEQIQRQMGFEISVVKLYQNPTIESLTLALAPSEGPDSPQDQIRHRAQQQRMALSSRQKHRNSGGNR